MQCPLCQNPRPIHSANLLLHYFRILMGSHKYACLACGHKWRARPRFGRKQSVVFFPILALVSFAIFELTDSLSVKWKDFSSQNAGMVEFIKDPALGSKLMRASTDPSALKTLTASEKQKLQRIKKDMLSSENSAGVSSMVTNLVGDSGLAEKLIRSKGNPEALKGLSASEKKKLKELKNRVAPAQVQDLKSRFGS